ncbi:probable 2-oxoglutarate-dependent dioxygenase AOP1 [Rhodamnia argentea]|uniref:Probable 2-oxoglutarate-dependent dioxygenase AOP1 n=1 Tax=Rhodamnia argentea TaxID=178133 RepID=A0A8B8NV09_9MYRT|nr:probable 2-oxoglutarate-dependent dioxygenase AOP1 [Rhodamnia argentea]
MGSQSSLLPELPVIEFSLENLNPGTDLWMSTSKRVVFALEEYGCFVATYADFTSQAHNEIFQALEELFDLPTKIKSRNASEKPYFGYSGQQPSMPLYESLGIDDATTLEGVQSFTNLLWPAGNERFRDGVLAFSKKVSELEQMVKRMVFESYGVKEYCDSHVMSTTYLLRVMKYRAPEMDETNRGCNVHTDKSFMTILHQNQVNGLEVRRKDGDWIAFEPSPSSFLVMAGDAFLAWSNGRIHSAVHQVVMKEKKPPRYSLGLFAFHSGIIEVPRELAGPENPLKFKAFEHYGLLRYFCQDGVPKDCCTAQAYCGI